MAEAVTIARRAVADVIWDDRSLLDGCDAADVAGPSGLLAATDAGLRIAATCKIAELYAFQAPPEWPAAAMIDECCRAFLASFKIWNEATVGGNVCMSLPASPMVSLTASLEGVLTLRALDGSERQVPAVEFVTGRGWHISPDAPALDQLTDVLAAVRSLGLDELRSAADTYADAAELVAARDLATVAAQGASGGDGGEARALMMQAVVTGTVLGEAMLAALRRLAQEDASARLNPDPDPDC